jgi:ParB family chromosome partitioning protein
MAKKTGGLGRGLAALFDDSVLNREALPIAREEPGKTAGVATATKKNERKPTKIEKFKTPAQTKSETSGENVVYIKVTDIKPNSTQPRKNFNEELLDELAESIKEHGVIQPVLLRPASKGFELVAGERRWRAARKAGLKEIPAIVRELDERQNAFYALVENIQREDLNILEEAGGIQEIISKYELTQEEAAKVVGKSRSYVSNALRILKLPKDVKKFINDGLLSAGHARAIAGLPSEALRIEAATKAVAEGWSVRAVENYTGVRTERKKTPRKKSYSKDIEIRNIEERIAEKIGTKVRISGSERRGRLEILYFSKAELNSIISFLLEK